ncbi:PA3715 family protein [Williamwhitmania taraxaci]|uniref:Uncharacterized protein n=1 Tax=Williamwhitmania taraxaci TaxID=1640674 RepID=A0A1G6T2N6_9BACT|nr:hypothetical protein [Williamwhitmania taraxaci]SDD23261.1 hypothetical protein SAMN05216323_11102 [Williamwhitmania taraxaci]
MNKIVIFISALISCLFSLTGLSQTENRLNDYYDQLKIDKRKILNEFVTYKTLPYDTNSTIYVIPVKTDEGEGWWSADIHLFKTLTNSGKIITYSIFEHATQSDAIALYKIWIDTAPYKLTKSNSAFGIRLDYANNSRAAGFDGETLLLVEEKNGNFINILKLDVSKIVAYGGGDCENTEMYKQKSILVIDKVNSNKGYNKIIEKVYFEHFYLNKDCEDGKKEKKNFKNVFQFNDSLYICKGQRLDGW